MEEFLDEHSRIYIDHDPCMSLGEWAMYIQKLIDKYGSDAIMETDAGHNNVCLMVHPEKTEKAMGF
jgi:hypothetical protein